MNIARSPIPTPRIAAIIALQVFLFSGSALAADLVGKTNATFNWTAASGPVVEYAVFVDRNGTGFPATPEQVVNSTSVNLAGSYGDSLVVRVAARDDAGNQGPFSPNSDNTRFIEPPPVLNLSTASLAANVLHGGNPADQTFTIRNSGKSTLQYNIATNVAWLSVNPSGGTATTETDTFTVSFSATALSVGSHGATITVSADGLASQTIAVELTVTATPGALSLDKNSISTQIPVGFNAGDRSFVVSNIGGSVVGYTVSSNAGWATVSPNNGTLSPSASQTVSIHLQSSDLSPGNHTATITVNASGSESAPQKLIVNLEVTEPLGAPGKPAVVLVGGSD